MKKHIILLLSLLTAFVLAIQPAKLPKAMGLSSFESEDELRRVASIFAQRSKDFYFAYRDNNVAESLAPSLDSKGNVTQTNTQIQGIDEADTLKSDGEHVYTLFENVIRMYKIEGDTLKLVKSVKYDYEKMNAYALLLVDDQLVVLATSGGWWFRPYTDFGPESNEDEVKPDPGVSDPSYPGDGSNLAEPEPTEPSTGVDGDKPVDDEPIDVVKPDGDDIIDIMPIMPPGPMQPFTHHVMILDKTTLLNEHHLEIEGYMIGSRLNGTTLILVTSKGNWVAEEDIKNLEAKDVLPKITLDGEEFAFNVKDIQYINSPESLNMLTITKFDLSDLSSSFKHLMMDAHTMYMNHETLLLASTVYTYNERTLWSSEKTHIYSLNYTNELTLTASTSLNGHLLNQFALDEYEGVVRIALTVWGEKTSNAVYTLDADLKVLDSIQNLAPTESIYSVRFVQDRAYVVTFEQIDPFFVIDLSTPSDIKVLGELKIPGYSTYLHPIADHLILGFGRDVKVESDGRLTNGALKLSLFDVSQASNPVEKQNLLIGDAYSWGDIAYDHKALMVNPNKQLLGFFVNGNSVISSDGREEYKMNSTYYLISVANESVKLYDEISVDEAYTLKAIMVNDALHLLLPSGRVITQVYP